MKIKQMLKKILMFFCASIIVFSAAGCGNSTESGANLKEITDQKVINAIKNVDLDYQLVVPGNQLPYKLLWGNEGQEESTANSSEGYSTYLTEYKPVSSEYYLVYLPESTVNGYFTWLKSYEQKNAVNSNNYHFSKYDDDSVIDGKYFYCYQKLANSSSENLKFYKASELKDISFKVDGYKLVLCMQKKQAVIKENLTAVKQLNKEVAFFSKCELKFVDQNGAPEPYIFRGYEQYNQKRIAADFNYVGEKIEAFRSYYETVDAVHFLKRGDSSSVLNVEAKVVTEGDFGKCVLLPRYELENGKKIDLLSESTDFALREDVFGSLKPQFLNAFIAEAGEQSSAEIKGLYDYEKVVKIISGSYNDEENDL